MADFFTSPPVAGGAEFRAPEDALGRLWPAGVAAYVVSLGSPDTLQEVDAAHGLPVQPQAGAVWDGNLARYGGIAVGPANPVDVAGAVLATQSGTWTVQAVQAGAWGVAQSGTWTVGVTGTVAVGGSVAVSALPAGSVAAAAAKTFDFDTGVGVDTVPVFGVALPGNGGAVVGGTSANPLRVDPTGTTVQPVSGSVSSAQSGAWSVRILDGAGNALASAAAAPAGTEQALVVRNIPSGTQAVSGTVAVSGTATVTGTVTANQGGAPWAQNVTQLAGTAVDVNSGAKSAGTLRVVLATDQPQLANALKVDGSAVTQPVSGTVTAVLNTATNAGAAAKTFDFDTGVGVDTVTAFGIALPAGGGAVAGGTSANPIRVDPTGTTVQPVSGTVSLSGTSAVSGTVTANQGTSPWVGNTTQFGGNAVNLGAGNAGTGTLRVVLATDQPQLANKLLVTPDANSAVNLAQVAGAAAATGHGTAAGALRVELPTDGTGVVQPGNVANTTPWLANPADPAATTGTITATDFGSASTTNDVAQTVVTGTPSAGSAVVCALSGQTSAFLMVAGSALSSVTILFEASMDGGTTYVPLFMEVYGRNQLNNSTFVQDTVPLVYRGNTAGLTHVRARGLSVIGSASVRWKPGFGVGRLMAEQSAGGVTPLTGAWPVMVVDENQGIQPAGDSAARSIHTTADNLPFGQQWMAASVPVAIASDQTSTESRYDRREQELNALTALDLAASAGRGRAGERLPSQDRRGRYERGNAR